MELMQHPGGTVCRPVLQQSCSEAASWPVPPRAVVMKHNPRAEMPARNVMRLKPTRIRLSFPLTDAIVPYKHV